MVRKRVKRSIVNKKRILKILFFSFLIFLIGDCWKFLIPFGNTYCNYCLFTTDEKQRTAKMTSGFIGNLVRNLVRDCRVVPTSAREAIEVGQNISAKEDGSGCTSSITRIFNNIEIYRIKVKAVDPWGNPYQISLKEKKIETYTLSGGGWHGQSQIKSSWNLSFKSSDNEKNYIDTLKKSAGDHVK